MLAIELPPEVESRLETLAAKTGCSKEDYARDVIAQLLGIWKMPKSPASA